MPEFAALGCVFVVSAVESVSETVLRHLDKGHTRADVVEALRLTRAAGIPLRPSLVPFTPWASLDAMQTALELMAPDLPQARDANPHDFYDDRLVRELEQSGFIAALGR